MAARHKTSATRKGAGSRSPSGGPGGVPGKDRRRLRRILGNLLLAGSASLVALVSLEAGLRIFDPTSAGFFVWEPHLRATFRVDPEVVPGVTGTNNFLVNSRGLRADELTPAHELRILALGGSTTECVVLDQSEAWPYLVQERLSRASQQPVWVGNAGVSGHGSREHVFQMPRLLAAYPDTDVVVLLVGVNDLGLRLQQDDEYDPRFLDGDDVEDVMIPRAFRNYPLEFRGALPFYKRLELYARLRLFKNYLLMLRHSGEAQEPSGGNIVRWRENRRNAVRIRTRLPDLEEALAEYRRNLLRIVAAADSAGVPLVLMTQPYMWRPDLTAEQEGLLWWGGVGDFMAPGARQEFYSVEAMAEGMERYNQVLLSVCSESSAHCLDLASAIPKDTSIFYDGVHFNEGGARVVADLVSDFLRDLLGA